MGWAHADNRRLHGLYITEEINWIGPMQRIEEIT